MLDPLSALSLASAVVQFVDFSVKLISNGFQLYEKGELSQNSEVEKATEDLTRLSEALTSPSKNELDGTPIVYNSDEIALQKLALLSQKIGQDLLDLLEKLKSDQLHKGLESFRKAVRAIRSKGKVESFENRLSKLQVQINTRLLIILSDKQSSVTSLLREIAEEHRQDRASLSNRISNLKGELLESIKQQQNSTGPHTAYRHISTKCLNLAEEGRKVVRMRQILSSLHFSHIRTRLDDIKEAHSKTFEWVFENPTAPASKPAVHLVKWMETGNGIYWISGKAGSGKSTFMKFFSEHERTQAALQRWSGTRKLLTAYYYFWSAGNEMQKSQLGLLRSLLYQILKQCPDLIPSTCSTRWFADDVYLHNQQPWTVQELTGSFEALAQSDLLSQRICLFVDGLDEYDGEHMDIIKAVQKLAESSEIKLCISSRPWNIFNEAFGGDLDRQLRLHDFTRDDIALYVNQTLEGDHHRFTKLAKEDDRYQSLIQEIVDKAQGVFLWVYLVVRSLLRGLTDDNDISTLQERLAFFPSDLGEYFKKILDTIEDVYEEQAARIFLVVVQAGSAIPAMAFHFLSTEKRNPMYSLQGNSRIYSDEKVEWMSDKIRKYVNARCKDLLEINTFDTHDVLLRYRVDFLHRTVRDFLLNKDMLSLLKIRVDERFDPRLSLGNAYLAIFKASVRRLTANHIAVTSTDNLTDLMQEVLHYTHEIDRSGGSSTQILDEFDRFACFNSTELGNLGRVDNLGLPRRDIFLNFTSQNFVKAAVKAGLCGYVSYRLGLDPDQQPIHMPKIECQPLLSQALCSLKGGRRSMKLDVEMVKLLLDSDADPNEINEKKVSVWADFLARCYIGFEKADGKIDGVVQEDLFQVAKMMVQHGAKLDEQCFIKYRRRGAVSYGFSQAVHILQKVLTDSQYEEIESVVFEHPWVWIEQDHSELVREVGNRSWLSGPPIAKLASLYKWVGKE